MKFFSFAKSPLSSSLAFLWGLLSGVAVAAPEPPPGKWNLWYERPAQYWEEALPVGNGRIGAMVYGNVRLDQIQLNENTIWSGKPTPRTADPAFREERRRKQQLLFANKHAEADAYKFRPTDQERQALGLAEKEVIEGTTEFVHSYQPLGDLFLHFDHGPNRELNYRRWLDLSTGITTTTYVAGGVAYKREVFASHPAQALLIRISADKPGAVTFTAFPDYPTDVEKDWYRMAGSEPGLAQTMAPPAKPVWKPLKDSVFSWTGQARDAGTKFEARFRVINEGGAVETDEKGFRVERADAVTILMTVGTDYRGRTPAEDAEKALAALQGAPYEFLRARHVEDHGALFNRVDLDLGRTEAAKMPTDWRVLAQMRGNIEQFADPAAVDGADRDPALFALYFQYGRYLLIASSRPGNLPMGLQGLWNDSLMPPWRAQYYADINIEMNYWPAEVTNLGDLHAPLLDLISSFSAAGRESARVSYGQRGLALHTVTPWGPKSVAGYWPDFSGWMAEHFWEHYAFTQDRDYLKKQGYPYLKDCALFYLDSLVQDPRNGWLVTGPTMSMENRFIGPDGKEGKIDMGTTMSMGLCRDVFRHTIKAAQDLGVDENLRKQLEETLPRLAPYQVGRFGQLQEWLQDYQEWQPGHRHFSPLIPFYPGNDITVRKTPALAEAVRKSLLRRLEYGGGWNGWSRAWAIALAARLGDGELARDLLKTQMAKAVFPNLMDGYPRKNGDIMCFQIDGNLGTTAAVAEMLLQSHEDEIHLLPARPKAWTSGSCSGLRARGGFQVDLRWADGGLIAGNIVSLAGTACVLRTSLPVMIGDGAKVIAQSQKHGGSYVASFPTEAGKTYSLKNPE